MPKSQVKRMVVDGWRAWAKDHDWTDVRLLLNLVTATFIEEDALLPDEMHELQRQVVLALADPRLVPD